MTKLALWNPAKTQRLQIVLVAALVAIAGFLSVFFAHAASSATSAETESGTISGNAQTVSDSSASGGQAVVFGSSGSRRCAAYPSHPDASCTGIQPGSTLLNQPTTIISNGGTYSNINFTTSSPQIYASNVTFTNCVFPTGAVFRDGSNVSVSYSEFVDGVAFTSTQTANFHNNNIHNYDDGIDVTTDGTATPTNINISENWFHTPTPAAGDHSDGIQVRGVNGLVLSHNTFDEGPWFTVGGVSVLNSAIYFEDANGGNFGLQASNNYLDGGGYTLYATGGTGFFNNNEFGPDDHYGLVYPTIDPNISRSGNIDSTGNPVNF